MLYTRKGDTGTTKAFDSKERILKSSVLPEALGAFDELNSFVGLVKAQSRGSGIVLKNHLLEEFLEEVQENLFIVQAELAGAKKRIVQSKIFRMERAIDEIEKEISALKGFSIVGGTPLSAFFDVARTLARAAERRAVAVHESGVRVLHPATLAYINRLSSLLFALARLVNHRCGIKEKNPTYK